ncbi:glycosyltransferase family 2 protein [Aequorivita echinoideorum]|uniref:Glycosyltransferase n=1 Tax=Aequorivita echinoideorum TaxID=1549647 RepID=A0ABS5S3Z4_9FLAO|nr:glycosyltransferase family 2 protein [Aequorivita echinoideorum]MBT0607155.1 glycosyltransferase [Aequorivita echinoideorum]
MPIDISIIIPVYNTQEYIMRCINSVLKQDLKNIEIIIVDDASTDTSYETILKIQRTDNRIKLLRLKENRGQAFARNLALSKAVGDYILFLDSDDFLEENVLKKLYDISKKYDLDILEARYNKITDNKSEIKPSYIKESMHDVLSGEEYVAKSGDIAVVVWNKLWKRSFLNSNKIQFEDRKFEDVDFVVRALLISQRVKSEKIVIYNYIVRNNSTMTSGITLKKTQGYVSLMITLDKLIHKTQSVSMKKAIHKILIYTFLSAPDYFHKKMKNEELVEYKKYKTIYKKNRLSILGNEYTNLPLKILVSINPLLANMLYKKIKKI